MLPNHAPLVIAEQFGTLESLYPGPHRPRPRARAGHRPAHAARAAARLRRAPTTFPQDVLELQALLATGAAGPGGPARSRAPGSSVPIWILGSSLFGAQLAAALGLPFAFASHFAPAALMPALATLPASASSRRAQLDRPYVMARRQRRRRRHRRRGAAPVHVARSRRSRTRFRGTRGQLPPPIDDIERYWSPVEKAQVSAMLACSFVGAPGSVLHGLASFVDRTGVDELIVAAAIYDHEARLRSYEILADVAFSRATCPRLDLGSRRWHRRAGAINECTNRSDQAELTHSRPRDVALTGGGRALVVFAVVLFMAAIGAGVGMYNAARPAWLESAAHPRAGRDDDRRCDAVAVRR